MTGAGGATGGTVGAPALGLMPGLRSVDVLQDSRLLELLNCFEEHVAFKPKVKFRIDR